MIPEFMTSLQINEFVSLLFLFVVVNVYLYCVSFLLLHSIGVLE